MRRTRVLGEWYFRRLGYDASGFCHEAMVRRQRSGQSLTQVPKEVPSISDLDRTGRCSVSGLGIETCTIATDNFYARMRTKPRGGGVGASIGQQIDNFASFEVAHDGLIALSLAPRPVRGSVAALPALKPVRSVLC